MGTEMCKVWGRRLGDKTLQVAFWCAIQFFRFQWHVRKQLSSIEIQLTLNYR
ncbi:hypothetical protein SAMN02745781_00381 [Vibrio gazogenes DSM 21264]|uniref:Uncharacterized protein n=1 Tax=Vibrio gazogenes DSM 21264 = NBRC 103151 TaxID=1123492 RepID=A0A1M4TSD2_VIBGA|nr:hypothetical protein SAMN02745781_00381 [Vibrio gazogenes DSM 21264] [Vibrio gazogenes DSM 21264 = NBRC 103151]SJN53015.1 hypothetical protein BQ6471_00207 [Vibrio gazogenes]